METGNELNLQRIQTLSELSNRLLLGAKMGFQYDGKRDIFKALGYPTQLKFEDFYARYLRQDIAKAIINRPVKSTWQGPLELVESNEPEDTDFEKAWIALERKFGLKTRFARIDRLTGLGRYGVLLLGLSDAPNIDSLVKPVSGKPKLIYVKPFSEKTAKIASFVTDGKNIRYGMPLFYDVVTSDNTGVGTGRAVKVHYSRVIHVTDEDALESEVYGTPRLESVFNRLLDLDKVVGGGAEMFWRNARPGFKGKVDPDYTITADTKADLQDQLDDYENDLRRFLINEGIEVEPFTQSVSSPKDTTDTILKMISAETGIPMRILSGSERGELSSSEDRGEWLSYVQARREEHAEPRIIRPTIDRFIELGILPEPEEDYSIKWADLFSISEKARVEIGKSRANALREYMASPMAEAIIPPTVFMMKFLGLTPDEIELVEKIRDDEMQDEVNLMAKVKEKLDPTPAPAGLPGKTDKTRPKSATGTPRKAKTPVQGEPKRRIRKPI